MSILIYGKDFKQIYDEINLGGKNDGTGGGKADFYNDLPACGVKQHPVTGEYIFVPDALYKTSLDYTILKPASNVEQYEIEDKNSDGAKSFYKVINLIKKAQKENTKKKFSQKKSG